MGKLRNILSELAELLFVPRCSACKCVLPSSEQPLCPECAKAYELEWKSSCTECSRPHPKCVCRIEYEGLRLPLVHVTSYDMRRSSVSKSMILTLKKVNAESTFDQLAGQMYEALTSRYIRLFERGNVIISYVPRSKRSRQRDGHDQSEKLAKRIAKLSNAPLMPLFENHGRRAQKTFARQERMKNAEKSYGLLHPELRLDGMRVIIIDDVCTSGASLGACAVLALKNGAAAVISLACARTLLMKNSGEF